jgi:hypothetical protein
MQKQSPILWQKDARSRLIPKIPAGRATFFGAAEEERSGERAIAGVLLTAKH